MRPDAKPNHGAVLADRQELLVEIFRQVVIVIAGLKTLPRLAPEVGRAKKNKIDLEAMPLQLRGDPARPDAIDVVRETDQTDGGAWRRARGHSSILVHAIHCNLAHEVFARELAHHEELYSGAAQELFAKPAVRALRRHIARRVLDVTGAGKQAAILSLGSGLGDTEILLASQVGRITGV